jgi:hypothetical protein
LKLEIGKENGVTSTRFNLRNNRELLYKLLRMKFIPDEKLFYLFQFCFSIPDFKKIEEELLVREDKEFYEYDKRLVSKVIICIIDYTQRQII